MSKQFVMTAQVFGVGVPAHEILVAAFLVASPRPMAFMCGMLLKVPSRSKGLRAVGTSVAELGGVVLVICLSKFLDNGSCGASRFVVGGAAVVIQWRIHR